ncbi:Dabb family protein [Thalassoglobus sp. JC818]|uniref:Dabb family protein n=1 Tax=Thalassoglobus sp. JC818 TaxID=3232136 RepID=UPI00345A67DE
MIVHNVYFTLNDPSESAVDHMVQECNKYLKNHPGVTFFAAGKCEDELARPVNDRMYHVALHVVFDTRQAHDDYQVAEAHLRFIDDNKASWKQVRVFDSNC